MKTIGIVSEYNPFHNGHKYHIQAAREQFKADNIVCIMSGNFVQRGEPAIVDKWSRAKMALHDGADLVIELPFVYSCQPAEIFAFGAVNTLNNLGVIDGICFGSESGNAEMLRKTAALLLNEPEDFSQIVKRYLGEGNTYPRSVSMALADYYRGNESVDPKLWETPNNILGIEYIKSILTLKSPMEIYTIKRIANNYNDTEISQPIASATAVRRELKSAGLSYKLATSMPEAALSILQADIAAGRGPIHFEDFSDIMLYRLRSTSIHGIKSYMSISEGLEYRIKKAAYDATCIEELIEAIKTKRYTRAFIQRLLCHILLDLKWEDSKFFKQPGTPSYCRVLGFNDKGKQLLRKITDESPYPVINKVAAFQSDDSVINFMFGYDLHASDIYNLARPNNSFKKARQDFRTSPIYV